MLSTQIVQNLGVISVHKSVTISLYRIIEGTYKKRWLCAVGGV